MPITSGSLHSMGGSSKSPATIRNDLKTLEDMGLLKQLHTSSGRVPTTDGYRIYVNHLFGVLKIDAGELAFAADKIATRTGTIPQIIEDVCKRIEKSIDYPILVKQNYGGLIIEEIKLVNLLDGNTLCLIRTSSGSLSVQLDIGESFTQSDYDDASCAFNAHFNGKTLAEMFKNLNTHVKQIKTNVKDFEILCKSLAENIESFIAGVETRGYVKLLSFHEDLNKVKDITKTLSDQDKIKNILSENGVLMGEVEGSSIININCNINGKNVAKLGILGPERMDYKKLLTAIYALLSETQSGKQLANNNQKLLEGRKK